jgi:hypothetical protein
MKRGALVLAIAGVAAVAGAAAARPLVVVELYTAQGCVSCTAASARLGEITADKSVLPLSFAVDYWDYLGWKDTFAKPEFAERQRAYDKRLGVAEVFTPQVIVDGRDQAAAVKPAEVDRLIHDARDTVFDPPQMNWRGHDKVAIGGGRRPRGGADIWLIRYDPRQLDVEVKQGDNAGHTVPQRNVVVQLERLGRWRGPMLLKLPPAPQDGLKSVVLVQGADGGRIIGVLPPAEKR